MTGFIALTLIGGAAFAALAVLRVARPLWSFMGAALFLGAAGYAWQGRPSLPAQDARPQSVVQADEPDLIALRDTLLGRYTADTAYIIASDAMARSGDRRAAAQVILGGLRKIPRSFILWTQLGTTLAARDGDVVSPPALFAFQQAARLAPEHPAPPFYAGLAYVRAGEFARARQLWMLALERSPEGASYRRDIAEGLAVLDTFLAMERVPPTTRPPR